MEEGVNIVMRSWSTHGLWMEYHTVQQNQNNCKHKDQSDQKEVSPN